jgi:hypothetical protein
MRSPDEIEWMFEVQDKMTTLLIKVAELSLKYPGLTNSNFSHTSPEGTVTFDIRVLREVKLKPKPRVHYLNGQYLLAEKN